MGGLIAYAAVFGAHVDTDFMSTNVPRVLVDLGKLTQVVNAEAERSGSERYPAHGFLLAMFDRALDRLVKIADKGWLYRLHSDDD